MKKRIIFAFFLLSFLGSVAFADPAGGTVVGAAEMVYLEPPGRFFSSRIDTGAALCSLNAYDIVEFHNNGELWVRFSTAMPEDQDALRMERPVERVVWVRQGDRPLLQKRFIVLLKVRLGPLELVEEFSLSDRRHMSYPVLIGRNLLSGRALVDVSREYLHQ